MALLLVSISCLCDIPFSHGYLPSPFHHRKSHINASYLQCSLYLPPPYLSLEGLWFPCWAADSDSHAGQQNVIHMLGSRSWFTCWAARSVHWAAEQCVNSKSVLCVKTVSNYLSTLNFIIEGQAGSCEKRQYLWEGKGIMGTVVFHIGNPTHCKPRQHQNKGAIQIYKIMKIKDYLGSIHTELGFFFCIFISSNPFNICFFVF